MQNGRLPALDGIFDFQNFDFPSTLRSDPKYSQLRKMERTRFKWTARGEDCGEACGDAKSRAAPAKPAGSCMKLESPHV